MSPDETDAAATPAPEPQDERPFMQRVRDEARAMGRDFWRDLRWGVPFLLFAVLGLGGLLHEPWEKPTTHTEDLDNMTDAIFSSGQYAPRAAAAPTPATPAAGGGEAAAAAVPQFGLLVPFEILSALLLAALIAGIVIAMRERDGDS